MAESALALSVVEIEDHVVVVVWAGSHGNSIKVKLVTDLPRNYVISARGIAAETEPSNDLAVILI